MNKSKIQKTKTSIYINQMKLSTGIKQRIRKTLGVTPADIRTQAKELGVKLNEVYEIQYYSYREVKLLEKAAVFKAKREAKIAKIREIGTTTIEEFIQIVNNKFNGRDNVAFEIELHSYMNKDIIIEKKFKSLPHFNAWVKQYISAENDYTDSANTDKTIKKNVFARFTYKINEIAGGANESNERAESRVYKGTHYNITIKQKRIQHNNCGPECLIDVLGLDITAKQVRDIIDKPAEILFTLKDMYDVARHFGKRITIHTTATDYIQYGNNILFNNKHYSVIESYELLEKDPEGKFQRGKLFWDIETRKTEDYCMIGTNKSYYILDTILCLYSRPIRDPKYLIWQFTTTDAKSACRQFLDWLIIESRAGRHYFCYAHNGGNFDTYFLMMNFNAEEAGEYEPSLRGSTIISLNFAGHCFKDTCCFLTNSLDNLSKNFKIETPKLKTFIVNGKELTNMQMCFYKPELTFKQFMALEHTEPEFWALYTEYCMVDCISLSQIWEKFEGSYIQIIESFCKAAPHAKNNLLKNCKLNQSCTIGGIALKILEALNKDQYAYKFYLKFLQNADKKTDAEKHDFVMKNFKRGGISHCNKKGKHTKGVKSVDICSQYPASMMHMNIPAGVSTWTTEYNSNKHGFYILKNIEFESELSFKPVCEVFESGVLNWTTHKTIDRLCVDSYMIKYLQQNFGLISFDIEKGLVSDHQVDGQKLFGKYVEVLFNEKAQQDIYKKSDAPEYNPSYRDTIKLFLNAVTGKLVMDKAKYNSLKFTDDTDGTIKNINGVNYAVEVNKNPFNTWVVAGVMIYSYSKRLLFEYINMLPNKSDDVIHVETDSIYFPKNCDASLNKGLENYSGEYPCAFGDALGNIKIEKDTNDVCYFLGKKTYYIAGNCIYKGIPSKTISEDGTTIKNLSLNMYERVYNHRQGDAPIVIKYSTMVKTLFGKTSVTQHWQTRTLNSSYDYSEF